jgi:hypothetical protein
MSGATTRAIMRIASLSVLLTLAITSCATSPEDDNAEGEDLDGKADGISLVGNYVMPGGGHYNNDVPSLSLGADKTYARVRCYGASCAKRVRESDHYQAVKSSSGKIYLRFDRFVWVDHDTFSTAQKLADSYEVKLTSTGIALRKTYTTRWMKLDKKTDEALCTTSHGTWKPTMDLDGAAAGTTTHCDCGQDPNKWPSPAFVPGAGGCITAAATNEDDCDTTNGYYTDDDRDSLGDYCRCPLGTAITDMGCIAI